METDEMVEEEITEGNDIDEGLSNSEPGGDDGEE